MNPIAFLLLLLLSTIGANHPILPGTHSFDGATDGTFSVPVDKPIPNNPNNIFSFHSSDHTNLNNGTRTCFQPAATQPIHIKGVDNSSCTSHFVIKMLDMIIIIRSKVSIQTGRSDNYDNALFHYGIILYIAVVVIVWFTCYTSKCISTKKLKQITKNWKNWFTTNNNKKKSIFVVNEMEKLEIYK